MAIKAQIIADSIGPTNKRLTTWILEYPRFVHSELMTHRVFSKNAASSRAIPVEKMIQSVIDNPAIPVWWGKNQSGMQANEELDNNIRRPRLLEDEHKEFKSHCTGYEHGDDGFKFYRYDLTDLEFSKILWLYARDGAINNVRGLLSLGLHKQISNRILEPWFHMRIILSGTDFDNWFALRAHKDAQPEIRALAYEMLEIYNASEPKSLNPFDWHIPFGDQMDDIKLRNAVMKIFSEKPVIDRETQDIDLNEYKIKIAIARCARISYFNYEGKDDYYADINLCEKLFGSVPRHLSPTEHVAQCLREDISYGNFRGWKQFRYNYFDQSLVDSRVIKKTWKNS